MHTFTLDAVEDLEGLLPREVAPKEPTVYATEDFDGAFAEQAGLFAAERVVLLFLSKGRWNDRDPVTLRGFRHDGDPVVDQLFLSGVVGVEGAVVRASCSMHLGHGLEVELPAQPGSKGASFSIGVGDVVGELADLRAGSEGRVSVVYHEGFDDELVLLRGERLRLPFVRLRSERTDALPVTLFFPSG